MLVGVDRTAPRACYAGDVGPHYIMQAQKQSNIAFNHLCESPVRDTHAAIFKHGPTSKNAKHQ